MISASQQVSGKWARALGTEGVDEREVRGKRAARGRWDEEEGWASYKEAI